MGSINSKLTPSKTKVDYPPHNTRTGTRNNKMTILYVTNIDAVVPEITAVEQSANNVN